MMSQLVVESSVMFYYVTTSFHLVQSNKGFGCMSEDSPKKSKNKSKQEAVLTQEPAKEIKFSDSSDKSYEVERFQDASGKWFERFIKVKEMEVHPFEELEEVDYELISEKRRQDILETVERYIESRPEYVSLESRADWMLIAKVSSIRINRVYNPDSFQEMDKTQEEQKCTLTVVIFGEHPKYGDSAFMLIEMGCPVIRLHNKYDINKLDSI
jgi:hypothetical protein